ncbi:MAG: (4Fe-4S)-binding protein [Chitinophagales bacterium]
MDKKLYKKGGLTVIWQPKLCRHSGNCVRGLNSVFNYKLHPWINMDGAEKQAIIDQVKKCPSGALSFMLDEEEKP